MMMMMMMMAMTETDVLCPVISNLNLQRFPFVSVHQYFNRISTWHPSLTHDCAHKPGHALRIFSGFFSTRGAPYLRGFVSCSSPLFSVELATHGSASRSIFVRLDWHKTKGRRKNGRELNDRDVKRVALRVIASEGQIYFLKKQRFVTIRLSLSPLHPGMRTLSMNQSCTFKTETVSEITIGADVVLNINGLTWRTWL